MDRPDRLTARQIIEALAQSGQPPTVGVEYFTVGLDPILNTFDQEYLSTHIRDGGSAFKLVVAPYGSGKTHLMYLVRDRAWLRGHAVALVTLNHNSVAFHKLEQVYMEIARTVTRPLEPSEMSDQAEFGVQALIRSYYARRLSEAAANGTGEAEAHREIVLDVSMMRTESISFMRAFRLALENVNSPEVFDKVCQWLLGESNPDSSLKKLGITERIDRSTAFRMIRSLVQLLTQLGFSGLTILFDEAEHLGSLSGKNKQEHLGNLRELIDACFQTKFRNVFVLYAVPDENFLTSGGNVYEALKQRVDTVFDRSTPSGVKVRLDSDGEHPEHMLVELGHKLVTIYEIGRDFRFPDSVPIDAVVQQVADQAVEIRFADTGYRREFVKNLIARLDSIRAEAR